MVSEVEPASTYFQLANAFFQPAAKPTRICKKVSAPDVFKSFFFSLDAKICILYFYREQTIGIWGLDGN